ncbi:Rh97 [macacine betaherpesvirus 3]|nr:Rh97 [macacine betaherpesvirus 3]
MSFEREERAHFRETQTAHERPVATHPEGTRHRAPAPSHIYTVAETPSRHHVASHPWQDMDLHKRYRGGPALSQLSDRERRAQRARRFCLDHESEHTPPIKRSRYEAACTPHHHQPQQNSPPVRDSPESPPPGPDSGRRPQTTVVMRHHHHHHSHHRQHPASSNSRGAHIRQHHHQKHRHGGEEAVTVSPATSSNRHMLALINQELDSMDENQLRQLSRMIEKKKEERQRLKGSEVRGDDASQPSSTTSPVYDLQRYTAESLHLTPYPDDLKKPTAFPQDKEQPGRLLMSHEELMSTDYLLNIRQQFDWLPASLLRRLVIEKSFSIFNAPSMHALLAMVDETLSYMKYHFVHGLPVNPYDPYMATVAGLRQLMFNKLNNLDLACILDNGQEWSDNCQTLKNLVRKPNQMIDECTRDTALELQKRPPEVFENPIHRALAYVCSFSRAILALRRRSRQIQNTPHFLDQYDDNGAISSYRCGMVAELILNALHQHQCQNELCELRIQKALQAYQFMLAYCPFDTKCLVDLTVFQKDDEPQDTPMPSMMAVSTPQHTETAVVAFSPASYQEPVVPNPVVVATTHTATPPRPASGVSPLNRDRTVFESNSENYGNLQAVVTAAPQAASPQPQQQAILGTSTDMAPAAPAVMCAGHEINFAPSQEMPQQQPPQQPVVWPTPFSTNSPVIDTGGADSMMCAHIEPSGEPDWVAAISALSTLSDSSSPCPSGAQQHQQPQMTPAAATTAIELFADSAALRCQTPEYEDMCYSDEEDDDDDDEEGYL